MTLSFAVPLDVGSVPVHRYKTREVLLANKVSKLVVMCNVKRKVVIRRDVGVSVSP